MEMTSVPLDPAVKKSLEDFLVSFGVPVAREITHTVIIGDQPPMITIGVIFAHLAPGAPLRDSVFEWVNVLLWGDQEQVGPSWITEMRFDALAQHARIVKPHILLAHTDETLLSPAEATELLKETTEAIRLIYAHRIGEITLPPRFHCRGRTLDRLMDDPAFRAARDALKQASRPDSEAYECSCPACQIERIHWPV